MAETAKRPWETKLSEAAQRIETELRAAVKTIDEEVVPEVRKHGSAALRTLATRMQGFADHLDDARRRSEAERTDKVPTGEPPHTQS